MDLIAVGPVILIFSLVFFDSKDTNSFLDSH